MKHIGEKLRSEIKQRNSNQMLEEFLFFLNPGRAEKGLKPITYARLNYLLKHLDTWDKSIFLGSCKEALNPSAHFWSSLKIK